MNKRGRRTEAQEAALVEARRVAHVGLLEATAVALRARPATSVPCYEGVEGVDPFDWLSDKDEVQRRAAAACLGCSVLDVCRAYSEKHEERAGVWGGRTLRERLEVGKGNKGKVA